MRVKRAVVSELLRAWSKFFKFLENPEKFKNKGIEIVKPPKYANSKTPFRIVTWDKTGFKIEGSRIRLWFSKNLKELLFKNNIAYQTPSEILSIRGGSSLATIWI